MFVRNLAIGAARLELTHYPTRLPRLQGIMAGRVTDFQSVLPLKKLPIELSPAHVQHMDVLQACMYVLSTWVMQQQQGIMARVGDNVPVVKRVMRIGKSAGVIQ